MNTSYKNIDIFSGKPYSLRIIKTEINAYFLMCIHHIFVDADGFLLIIKDIFNLYNGNDVCNNHFFAYLYDTYIEENSEEVKNNNYILKQYFDNGKWDFYTYNSDKNSMEYKDKQFCTGISINDLNDYLKKYLILCKEVLFYLQL